MYKSTQTQRFYEFLFTVATSCSHASAMLQIPQKTLCRRKRELELSGLLMVIGKIKCPITGRMVQKITTNPDLFIFHQLQLNFQ